MSNILSPIGFRWHGLYGDAINPTSGLVTMKISSADTVTAGEGDPLKFLATGYVSFWTKGTAASQFAGVFKSCSYYSVGMGRKVWKNYWPGNDASGDVTVQLAAGSGAPAPRFIVQSGGATAPLTMTSVWSTTDVNTTSVTGSIVGGFYRSGCTLDATTGTTTTSPFRIVGLWSDIGAPGSPGTDLTTPYNWVIVEANNIQATGI